MAVFHRWVEREEPAYSVGVTVRAWIDRLDRNPWQAPSEKWPEMSVDGEYQIRSATILGVDIVYREVYPKDGIGSGPVDLLDVRRHPSSS